ncbi:MAG: CBS domain-containing protein [Nitrospirales bacterium]|nr:MAG: CBS domain-containing protein [Nitrospirales bacterium]
MIKIRDIMTVEIDVVDPETNIQDAAEKMKELGIGIIPICQNHNLIGMLTDRDIIVRAVAEKKEPLHTPVQEVMTQNVIMAYEDQDIEEAERLMSHHQSRRLPIVNQSNLFVGMLTLGDLASRSPKEFAGEVLEEVSQPSKPSR